MFLKLASVVSVVLLSLCVTSSAKNANPKTRQVASAVRASQIISEGRDLAGALKKADIPSRSLKQAVRLGNAGLVLKAVKEIDSKSGSQPAASQDRAQAVLHSFNRPQNGPRFPGLIKAAKIRWD